MKKQYIPNAIVTSIGILAMAHGIYRTHKESDPTKASTAGTEVALGIIILTVGNMIALNYGMNIAYKN